MLNLPQHKPALHPDYYPTRKLFGGKFITLDFSYLKIQLIILTGISICSKFGFSILANRTPANILCKDIQNILYISTESCIPPPQNKVPPSYQRRYSGHMTVGVLLQTILPQSCFLDPAGVPAQRQQHVKSPQLVEQMN